MKSFYKTQLDFDFSGVTFRNRVYSEQTKVENKMLMKIQKHNFRRKHKIQDDIDVIKEIVSQLNEGEQIQLISKRFDSPNIVNSFIDEIEKLYVATWAITPSGIDSLIKIVENGKADEVYLLLDKTHSYKWIFTSKAYEILKGKVKIKFCANHSKFIAIQTKQRFINFFGSMNFSNNPRFENITINSDYDTFCFFKDFILNVSAEDL